MGDGPPVASPGTQRPTCLAGDRIHWSQPLRPPSGFTLIVDDTVHPDGSTSMEQVGGGGAAARHAACPHLCLAMAAVAANAAGLQAACVEPCSTLLTSGLSALMLSPQAVLALTRPFAFVHAATPCAPGPQTLWGFQLMRQGDARVGLAAGVGKDMPRSVKVGPQLSSFTPSRR